MRRGEGLPVKNFTEKGDVIMDDLLRRSVDDLTNQVNKMIGINMSLQSKIVELLVKITDLMEGVSEMTNALKLASEAPKEEPKAAGTEFIKSLLEQNQKMLEQNKMLFESMDLIQKYLKKMYRKQLVARLRDKKSKT